MSHMKKLKDAADTFDPNIERHRQKQLTLASTKRHVLISYPWDTTDEELLDFVGWLLVGFRKELPRADGIQIVRGPLVD